MVTINTLNGGDITVTLGGSTPVGRATTIITTQEDGAQEYLIEGNLTIDKMNELGLHEDNIDEGYWVKTITAVDFGTGSQANPLTTIGGWAFCNCENLTSVTISSSIRSITQDAFGGCSSLTSVTIPNSMTSIGEYAFYDCTGLTGITIPSSVTSIGDYAFSGCSGLTSVTIGNGVTSIGDGAFSSCEGLPSVTIPNSVTSIGSSAFIGCFELTSMTFEGKDRATVQGMTNYPFGLNEANSLYGATIHCTDGDIHIEYNPDNQE